VVTRRASKTSSPKTIEPSGALYPMRTVVRLTGVAPDTLRAWERRHDAVVPHRTAGNARRYSERDVRRLSLLHEAVSAGHAIGDVVRLSDAELERLGPAASPHFERAEDGKSALRARYLEALERFDARTSEAVLAQAAALVPPRGLAIEILTPILAEIGERWHAGTLGVAAEHLASGQIRRLAESLRLVHDLPRGAPRILLATPSGHRHDLGLVLASLLAIQRGVEPIQLGADLPLAQIAEGAARTKAAVVLLAVARDLTPGEKHLVKDLKTFARAREVWLGVPSTHELARVPAPLRVLTSLEAFDHALEQRFGVSAPEVPARSR
jgi:DNA-binding transcriptional MerR regulator